MAVSSAAMELKVLISVLQSGTALQTMLGQVNQLSQALSKLQTQANAGSGGGLGGLGGGSGSAQAVATGLNNIGTAGKKATEGLDLFQVAAMKGVQALKFLAGGFLALESVRFLKDLGDTAARTQVLATVLHVVARNAGVSREEIDKVSLRVQKLGITAQSANESLTKFLQAKLDVKFAEPLARAAQDLAVISGMDSSQTFSRLLLNIQQLDTMGLRWMGIVVSMTEATSRYAAAHGKAADALSQNEKQQALMNEVLEKAKGLQGTYEAAMGDVGKQMTSLGRLTTTLKDTLGKQLLPAYSALISEVSLFLEKLNDSADAANANMTASERFGEIVRTLAHELFELLLILYEYRVLLLELAALWAAWKYLPVVIGLVVGWAETLAITLSSLVGIITSVSGAVVGLTGAVGLLETVLTGGVFLLIVAAIAGIGYGIVKLTNYFTGATEASAGLYNATKKLADARDAESKAKIAASKTLVYGSLEEEQAAKKALDTAKKRREEAEKERDAYRANLRQRDPARLQREEEYERGQRRLAQLNATATAAATAREKLNVTANGLQALPKEFSEKLGGLNELTQQFVNLREEEVRLLQTQEGLKRTADEAAAALKNQQTAVTEVIEATRTLAQGVSSKEALARFNERNATNRALLEQQGPAIMSPAELKTALARFDEAAKVAQLGAKQGELAYLSPVMQQLQEIAKLRTDAATSLADATVKRQQVTASKEEALLEDQLDRHLLTYQSYYSALQGLEDQRSFAAVKAQEEKIKGLERQRDLERDPLKRQAKQIEIDQVTVQKEIEQSESRNKTAKLRLDLDKKIFDAGKEQTALSKDLAVQYGGEAAALAKINYEYTEQIQKNKVLAGQERETADRNAELKKNIATFDALKKSRDAILQQDLDMQEGIRGELDLRKQERDVETARIAALEKTGQISESEAMRLRNQQTSAALNDNQMRQQSLIAELARKRAAYAFEIYSLQQKLNAQTDDAVKIQQELATAQAGYNEEVRKTQGQVLVLQGEAETLRATQERYATQVYQSFTGGLASALTSSLTDFENWGTTILNFQKSLTNQIVSIWAEALTKRIFKMSIFSFVDRIAGFIGGTATGGIGNLSARQTVPNVGGLMAEGGVVSGPGTGTSDSIPAMVSAGEHIMPAAKAAQWMPLLEGIRTGKILPFRNGGVVQSIAIPSVIPRRYAAGGVVVSDAGAASVQTSGGGNGNMVVSLHPDALNMTMRDWLEHEVVRQHGRR